MTATTAERPRLGGRYWRLWTAGTISNFGDGVNAAALPLLAATLTRDPRLVAGMAVAASLPWLLFSLVAGALVDRLDRKRVMWTANVVRAGLVAGIATVAATLDGSAAVVVLYGIALCIGMAETMFDNAAQAMLPSIVVPELLPKANGRQYAAEMIANTFAGPPAGALLFSVAIALPFAVDAATFLVSAVLIATIAGSFRSAAADRPRDERATLRADIGEGLRWLRRHRLLRTLAIMLGVMNLTWMMGMATFVLFATETLGLSERAFGLLLTATAVGSVVAGFVAERIVHALGDARTLQVSAWSFVVVGVLTGLAPAAWQVAVVISLSGVFSVTWNVITVSLRQSIIPDELLGRVNSVYRFLGWGGMPVGALLGGFVAEALGLRAPWLIGAAILAACLALASPVIRQRTIDEARAAAPARA